MSRIRRYIHALALLAAICVTSAALAAPRNDDPGSGSFFARAKALIVRALDDIRSTLPPG